MPLTIPQETLDALKQKHGDIIVLEAGEGAELVQVAIRRLTKEDWAEVADLMDLKDPSNAEHALLLARVAPSIEELNPVLNDYPALADLWGAQVKHAAGEGATIKASSGASGQVLKITVLEDTFEVPVRKPARGVPWNEARKILAEKGATEFANHLFTSYTQLDDAARSALASKYPALPVEIGMQIAGLVGMKPAAPRNA